MKLGSTNKLLKQKLQRADIPLRVLAPNILTAVLAETTTGFHVGELVWARTALRANELHALAGNLPPLASHHLDQPIPHLDGLYL